MQRFTVAEVPPEPVGFFSSLIYDCVFLYQSGTNLDAGFGCSKSAPDVLVNIIFIFPLFVLLF
jgi:hypothetical protein